MLGAVDELSSRELIDLVKRCGRWSCSANTPRSSALSAVVDAAPDLERDAGDGPVVLPGGRGLNRHCHGAGVRRRRSPW